MRYQAGQRSAVIDANGNQFYLGIDTVQPHTDGRTAFSAARKYERWLKQSKVQGPAINYQVWDREDQQYVPFDSMWIYG